MKGMRTVTLLAASTVAAGVFGYPLDGAEQSGIRRLTGYDNAQRAAAGPKLPPGSLWSTSDVRLSLPAHAEAADFDRSPADPQLQSALEGILRQRDPSYSALVVDLSDPAHPAWAGVRADVKQNPGSVGKLVIMVGLFDALAGAFPDVEDRGRILRESEIRAGEWVITDTHDVPTYDPETGKNRFGVIKPADRFRLSEWVDHMISPSANAAGSVVWREAILLRRFGAEYPLSWEASEAYFRDAPKAELAALAQAVLSEPLRRAAIDTANLQQGSFFTTVGKSRVPGITSYATPRELMRMMVRMEQGRLVDGWSSLEMKRYLYVTKRRYRYIYAPELSRAATYFKSGSLYQCKAEEGFRCGKYMGNVRNLMNSVAIVEWPEGSEARPTRYLTALMSNVLKVNSAWDHSRLAAAIDQVVKTRQAVKVLDAGDGVEVKAAGEG